MGEGGDLNSIWVGEGGASVQMLAGKEVSTPSTFTTTRMTRMHIYTDCKVLSPGLEGCRRRNSPLRCQQPRHRASSSRPHRRLRLHCPTCGAYVSKVVLIIFTYVPYIVNNHHQSHTPSFSCPPYADRDGCSNVTRAASGCQESTSQSSPSRERIWSMRLMCVCIRGRKTG